jgi:hypothetical protein
MQVGLVLTRILRNSMATAMVVGDLLHVVLWRRHSRGEVDMLGAAGTALMLVGGGDSLRIPQRLSAKIGSGVSGR